MTAGGGTAGKLRLHQLLPRGSRRASRLPLLRQLPLPSLREESLFEGFGLIAAAPAPTVAAAAAPAAAASAAIPGPGVGGVVLSML